MRLARRADYNILMDPWPGIAFPSVLDSVFLCGRLPGPRRSKVLVAVLFLSLFCVSPLPPPSRTGCRVAMRGRQRFCF